MSSSHEVDSVLPDEITKLLADPSLPEPIANALRAGMKLERIELDAEGCFWHQGERFQNDKLSSLFHRSIQRTDGGTYLIVIPPYSYPFVVADAPRQVRHIRQDDARVWLVLSDEQEQILEPSTLSYVPDRGLYCQVDAPGVQRWPARFLRPAYYALLSHIDQQGEDYFLDLPGGRWPIPVVSQPPR